MKFLLNVGAEKAGTTWLYEYFRQHPEFKSIGKELNIIQRDDLVPCFEKVDEYRKDLHSFFLEVSCMNSVTGDFTHYEGSSENIFRLFKEGLSFYDIEIVPVYIMRDPIKRAWSSWNMLGGGNNFDMAPPAFFLTQNFFNCKYKETVQALDSVFGNALYFFYETFFQENNIKLICDRLGISYIPASFSNIVNRGVYQNDPPAEFIEKFGCTEKNKEAARFIFERFSDVPWEKTSY